ncbi:MAG: phosphocholine cytidylyltransferase family protein [Alphaproteobacteria bacterium]|nr:phosphocholine cytidylyltransferase family protein [Alphaproteobacteria bacterium]
MFSMKALILSAGQGSRLLPLTEKRPKCLLPIGDKTLIEWQIHHLIKAGIKEFAVVVGFHAKDLEEKLQDLQKKLGIKIKTIFNPFYNVADNLGSCWLARSEMDQDFFIVNGDTLFIHDIPKKVLENATSSQYPITVTVDHKSTYDSDDMKVRIEGTKLMEIGKTLPLNIVNGESIGMLFFKGDGPKLFADAVDQAMRTTEGLKWWYLKVIGLLAEKSHVGIASIKGLSWGEVDFPEDLVKAQTLVATWS